MKGIGAIGLAMALSLNLAACSTSPAVVGDPQRGAAEQSILRSSQPGAGAIVRGPLDSLELHFARPVALAEVTVAAPDGTTMPTMLSPAGETADYSVPLPALGPGRYKVAWRATAGGATYRGDLRFTVQ